MNVDEALEELLGRPPSADREVDLLAAIEEAWRRRHVNSAAGGAVINELHTRGRSWQQIEDLTGVPHATAYRWSTPPERADES